MNPKIIRLLGCLPAWMMLAWPLALRAVEAGDMVRLYPSKGNPARKSIDAEVEKKGWLDNRRWAADRTDANAALMHVGHTGGYGWWIVQMEFNLKDLPAHAAVDSATLRFRGRSWSKDKGLTWYDHRHTPGSIDTTDYGATFEPDFIDHLHDGAIEGEPVYGAWSWMEADVTEAVRDAVEAGATFLSLVVEREDPHHWEGGFYEIESAETANPDNRPVLLVKTSPADTEVRDRPRPTPPAWGAWKGLSPADPAVRLSDGATLAQRVAEIGHGVCTLLIDREARVTEKVTIPRNLTLLFVSPGHLDLGKDAVVRIEGPIVAPPAPCFSGSGTVTIANGQDIYADWWGADGEAIQRAIDACDRGRVLLLDNVYPSSRSIHGKRGVILEGVATDEIWTKNTGTVIAYTGRKPVPILDIRGPRWFGLRNVKLVGNKWASHGLITAHRGIESRAKHSEIDHVFIYDCGVGIDLGGTDDITLSTIEIFHCGIGLTGAHTQARFRECSFVGCKVGFEVMNASKCSFYKCLWCSNQDIDLLISAQDHPGGTMTFRDCWFENVGGTILKRNPALKKTSGMARFVFDGCKLHDYGYALFDCRGFERFGGEIVLMNCDMPPTCSSYEILDPAGKITVIGIPTVPPQLRKKSKVFELALRERTTPRKP